MMDLKTDDVDLNVFKGWTLDKKNKTTANFIHINCGNSRNYNIIALKRAIENGNTELFCKLCSYIEYKHKLSIK